MKKLRATKQKLQLNTLIDIEETYLRIELAEQNLHRNILALGLLANYRQDASLRQINNNYKLNQSAI